jgi:hypothetical protein
MTSTQPVRETSTSLGSVIRFDFGRETPQNALREQATAVSQPRVQGEVLRLPVRASLMFRVKTLLAAGAAVLAARIVAALFARR